MKIKKCHILSIFSFCISLSLTAQDIHFSQFLKAPLDLNPAFTAASDWDVRTGINWRQQWVQVPVNYQTFGGFYDQKLDVKLFPEGRFGVGASFIHDQAGDSQLSWLQLGLRLAYHYPFRDQFILSAGLGIDGGQRAFNSSQLQFADQYNGELFDPDQLTSEQFAKQSKSYVSQNFGINLKRQLYRSRTSMQVGFSLNHLNRPDIHFFDNNVLQLPLLYHSYTNGVIELTDSWDATYQAFWAQQGSYIELVVGAGVRYHLEYKEDDLILGTAVKYRWDDAFILQIEGSYQQWHLGLSYDINTSNFNLATNGRGGFELALHYYIMKAKPPEEFKSCPVF